MLAEERVLEAPLTWPVYVASPSVFVREASSRCWEAQLIKLWGGLSGDVGAGPGPPGFPPEQERGNFAASYLTLGHFLGGAEGSGGHTVGSPSPSPQGVAFPGKASSGDASWTMSVPRTRKREYNVQKSGRIKNLN